MKERNLTISKLAKAAGVNKSTLHGYLNGVNPKGVETIVSLASYFGLSIAQILLGSDKPDVSYQEQKSSLGIQEGIYELEVKVRRKPGSEVNQ